jgi:small subunit ribosomal protein S21
VDVKALPEGALIGRPNTPDCPALPASKEKEHALQVFVRDNNVDQALKALKRKLQREGVFREMKRRRFYEKPSAKSTREKAEAIRRARKLARKQAQREGLLADPRKKKLLAARAGARPGGRPGEGPGGAPGGGFGGDARRPPPRRF